MKKIGIALFVLAAFAGGAAYLSSGNNLDRLRDRFGSSATPTPTPKPTLPPVPAGGEVAMGRTVRTPDGDLITVYSWRRGANRSEAPGPGQVYETVDLGFCAGPSSRTTTGDVATLFDLQMPDGAQIAPDSIADRGEFRTKGTIETGACARGPVVFQVGGGGTPRYVTFDSSPPTKWVVK